MLLGISANFFMTHRSQQGVVNPEKYESKESQVCDHISDWEGRFLKYSFETSCLQLQCRGSIQFQRPPSSFFLYRRLTPWSCEAPLPKSSSCIGSSWGSPSCSLSISSSKSSCLTT